MAVELEVVTGGTDSLRYTLNDGRSALAARPSSHYRLVDDSGALASGVEVRRIGSDLVFTGLPGERELALEEFFRVCAPERDCSVALDTLGAPAGTTLTAQTYPMAAFSDGSFLMYSAQAPASGATAVGTGTVAESQGPGMGAILGGGALALGAAAGGGGGGGSDGGAVVAAPAPTPSPSPSPVPAPVQSPAPIPAPAPEPEPAPPAQPAPIVPPRTPEPPPAIPPSPPPEPPPSPPPPPAPPPPAPRPPSPPPEPEPPSPPPPRPPPEPEPRDPPTVVSFTLSDDNGRDRGPISYGATTDDRNPRVTLRLSDVLEDGERLVLRLDGDVQRTLTEGSTLDFMQPNLSRGGGRGDDDDDDDGPGRGNDDDRGIQYRYTAQFVDSGGDVTTLDLNGSLPGSDFVFRLV